MGVMSCVRDGCQNIMCDTYINGIGYICYDCQHEFKKYLIEKDIHAKTESEYSRALKEFTESEYSRALKEFMETEKDDYRGGDELSPDEFFRNHTID